MNDGEMEGMTKNDGGTEGRIETGKRGNDGGSGTPVFFDHNLESVKNLGYVYDYKPIN